MDKQADIAAVERHVSVLRGTSWSSQLNFFALCVLQGSTGIATFTTVLCVSFNCVATQHNTTVLGCPQALLLLTSTELFCKLCIASYEAAAEASQWAIWPGSTGARGDI
jgi:hypothetical protein